MLIIAGTSSQQSIPENFKYFSEFVKHCYESDALNLKFQALVVYHALNEPEGIIFQSYNLMNTQLFFIKAIKS